MKLIPFPHDSLLLLREQLCQAYELQDMPLVYKLSKEIDQYQIAIWKKNGARIQ